MTVDVSDLELDPVLAALAQQLHGQLHERGGALDVQRPPVSSITDDRRSVARSRRRWGFAVVAAAAAVALVLVVAGVVVAVRDDRTPSGVATDPATTAPPAPPPPREHVAFEQPDYRLLQVDRNHSHDMAPKGLGTGRPDEVATTLTVWSGTGGAGRPPMVAVATFAQPALKLPAADWEPVTIGGRSAFRSPSNERVAAVVMALDDSLVVSALGWGIPSDQLVALLDGSTMSSRGIEVARDPDGLQRHDVPDGLTREQSSEADYTSPPGPDFAGIVNLTDTDAQVGADWRLATTLNNLAIAGVYEQDGRSTEISLEEITVRGQPALLTGFRTAGDVPGKGVYRLIWHEPGSSRITTLSASSVSRDVFLGMVDHLRTVDEASWQQLVKGCPGPADTDPRSLC